MQYGLFHFRRTMIQLCRQATAALNSGRVLPLSVNKDRSTMLTRGPNVGRAAFRKRNSSAFRVVRVHVMGTIHRFVMGFVANESVVSFSNVSMQRHFCRYNGDDVAFPLRSAARRTIIRRANTRKRVVRPLFCSSRDTYDFSFSYFQQVLSTAA